MLFLFCILQGECGGVGVGGHVQTGGESKTANIVQ
jgi:hypothetical protein